MSSAGVRDPRRSMGLYAVPLFVVTVLTATLALMYLGGSVTAAENLHRFPLAVVDQDTGASTAAGEEVDLGATIVNGIRQQLNTDQYDLIVTTLPEAQQRMHQGALYGAIVIPAGFSRAAITFAGSAATAGPEARPTLELLTNPRAGQGATTIATRTMTAIADSVDRAVGAQMSSEAQQGASAAHVSLTGAAITALDSPVAVTTQAYLPLPDNTGSGSTPFYWALLIVLAGFTGSIAANTFIDSRLGFLPAEFGPLYRLRDSTGLSRLATLTVKWSVMTAAAALVAGVYLVIGQALGVPIDHPFILWWFTALAITGVAVVTQAINAILGNIGLLVNLLVFVILAQPSSGGTIPLEASPAFFRWLGGFEPLRQIYLAVRSVLYYDAAWNAGLGRGVIAALTATAAGLLVGIAGTVIYDRRNWHRRPAHTPPLPPQDRPRRARHTAPALPAATPTKEI